MARISPLEGLDHNHAARRWLARFPAGPVPPNTERGINGQPHIMTPPRFFGAPLFDDMTAFVLDQFKRTRPTAQTRSSKDFSTPLTP